MERLRTQSVYFNLLRLGGRDVAERCHGLVSVCGGEISSKGLLCTTEEKVQHKGEDGKYKLCSG